MSESCNDWSPDLSSVEGLSLAELADISLFAAAGPQAIQLLRGSETPDKLCVSLAAQALHALKFVHAPEACKSTFTAIAEGKRPTDDLHEVMAAMERMSEALSDELEKGTRRFNQLRGVRDL